MRAGDQDFELDLDGASGAGSDPDREGDHGAGARDRPNHSPLHQRGVPWLALGVVLVLVGIAAAPGPPPEQVGIIDRVAEPEQQWEADVGFDGQPDNDDGVVEIPEVHLAGDTVLYTEPEGVTALDAADGSQRWQAGGTDLRCHLSDPVLLCADGHGEDAELVHLHLSDGELSREPSPGLMGAIAVAGDVIRVVGGADGVAAVRTDSSGGTTWSHTLHEQDPDPGDVPADAQYEQTTLDVLADQVLISVVTATIDTDVILDAGTGTAGDLHGPGMAIPAAIGWQTEWLRLDPDTGEVLARIGPDGQERSAGMDLAAIFQIDDDLGSNLTFEWTEETLAAVSSRTGRTVWEWSEYSQPPRPIARLGEVLITSTGGVMTALDLGTGEQRWMREAAPSIYSFTDGEVLAFISHARDGAAFVGLDPETGAEEFEIEIGASRVAGADLDGRRMLVLTGVGLSLWTW